MNLQRIAWCAWPLILVVAGCQGPSRRDELGPPPSPILSTRPPRVIPAIPPPPREEPEKVVPEQRPSAVSAADIRVPGGIRRGRWKTIIVHHSASDKSTPQGMDSWHRQRGWSGLGYHFVIGGGQNYPDGKLFVGPRWKLQQTGAHCKAPAGRYLGVWRPNNFFNEQGIGICLIGDFDTHAPSARQMRTLQDLIARLIDETGISPGQVFGHGEVTNKTACPGRYVDMPGLRRAVAARAAERSPTASSDARRGY